MKKFIVSGVCTTLVCFMLSSFTTNSNYLAGTDNSTANYQDTSHKKMKKMDKSKMDTTSKGKKMHKEKKPA